MDLSGTSGVPLPVVMGSSRELGSGGTTAPDDRVAMLTAAITVVQFVSIHSSGGSAINSDGRASRMVTTGMVGGGGGIPEVIPTPVLPGTVNGLAGVEPKPRTKSEP